MSMTYFKIVSIFDWRICNLMETRGRRSRWIGAWVGIVIRSCYYWRDEVTVTSREDYDELPIIQGKSLVPSSSVRSSESGSRWHAGRAKWQQLRSWVSVRYLWTLCTWYYYLGTCLQLAPLNLWLCGWWQTDLIFRSKEDIIYVVNWASCSQF